MAHDLETQNGKTSFASFREPAWHGLGTVFTEEKTTAEMLEAANLNGWNVRLEDLETPSHLTSDKAYQYVLRTNPTDNTQTDILGVVGERYHVLQNEDLFSFGDNILDGGGRWETAGAIKGGRVVFGSLALERETILDKDGIADKVNTYLWGESPLLENLPPSGMTRNGVLFPQPQWGRITDATASSSWPTPTTQDHIQRKSTQQTPGSKHSVNLGDAIRMWPTPCANDARNATFPESQRKKDYLIGVLMREMWPTPRAAMGDARNHTVYPRSTDKPQNLENKVGTADPSAVGGKLNPTWVEWLMGFPTGWTDLQD